MKKSITLLCKGNRENGYIYIYIYIGPFFFHSYLLICLNNDTPVLAKVINIKLSIKTMVLTIFKNTMYMHTMPLIKL